VTQTRTTICTLCSLGCGLKIEVDNDVPVALDYCTDCPATGGALCAKGNYALELLNHPRRMDEPRCNGRATGWEVAAAELRRALESPRAALVVEGDMSDEEAALLASFASECLPANRMAVNIPTGDAAVLEALAALPAPMATVEDLRTSACTIAVNDPFSVGPVVARWVLSARNAAREHTLNVIAPADNMVSKFATSGLIGPARAGLASLLAELARIAGPQAPPWAQGIEATEDAAAAALANEFRSAQSGVIVLSTADPVEARLAALCAMAAGKKLFLVHEYANTAGIARYVRAGSVEAILDAIATGAIDSLVVLGSDLAASYPGADVRAKLDRLNVLIAGAPFANQTTALADVVLPTAVWLEKEGTFNNTRCEAAAPPAGGALAYGEILRMAGRDRFAELKPAEPAAPAEAMEPDAAFVRGVISQARQPFETPLAPSATGFGDRSVTDQLSWPRALALAQEAGT